MMATAVGGGADGRSDLVVDGALLGLRVVRVPGHAEAHRAVALEQASAPDRWQSDAGAHWDRGPGSSPSAGCPCALTLKKAWHTSALCATGT